MRYEKKDKEHMSETTTTRRRRAATTNPDAIPAEQWPQHYKRLGSCAVPVDGHPCGYYVFDTPAGACCIKGHGDPPMNPLDETGARANAGTLGQSRESASTASGSANARQAEPAAPRVIDKRPGEGFEVREGDKLYVQYNGVKLSIAAYSTVELDGGSYTRTLEPGDDVVAEWDKIHGYLRAQVLKGARQKLSEFAEELAAAKKKAQG